MGYLHCVFNKDYNKLKYLSENNTTTNTCLKYLMIQHFIQVEKKYIYIDELIKIKNDNG